MFQKSPVFLKKIVLSLESEGLSRIFWKQKWMFGNSVLALTDGEWRAAASGLKPLYLPCARCIHMFDMTH